jgi:uncharacterized membrane protein
MTDTGATGTGPPSAAGPRWPRWKSMILIASLALNLLIFGMMAAVGIRHGFQPPRGASQATVLNFARTLPAERKREIWDSLRAERRALRPYWRELRKARYEVREALTAEPLDIERYRKAHDNLLNAEVKVRKAAHSLYELVATRLTADERRAFARWQHTAERPWRRRAQERGDAGSADETDDEAPTSAPSAVQPAGSAVKP